MARTRHYAIQCVLAVHILCALMVYMATGQDISPGELQTRVDEMMDAIMGCREIVGLTLAVVKGNETLLTKGFGKVDLEGEALVTDETLFGIASLTKAFTATLLGQELAENNYTWDTPLREILGDDFHLYDELRTCHVSSKDIGSHRTGIPRNNYARMQEITREGMVGKLRFFEPTLEFRSSYQYNNLMYGLMSYVSEQLGGASWEDLTRSRIFNPLGMRSSTFTHETDLHRDDIAKPYMLTGTGDWRQVALDLHSEWGALGGSGAILTNAQDMAQWLHLQLNRGINKQGQRVIDEEVLKQSHTPVNVIPPMRYAYKYQAPAAPITFTQDAYALGWRRGSYRGRPVSVHTGTSWGYGGLIMILHEADIAVFIAITGVDKDYNGRYLLEMFIIDLLLGLDPWIDVTTVCSFPRPWNEDQSAGSDSGDEHFEEPMHPLEKYAGVYSNYGYGLLSFAINSAGKLELRYGSLGSWELAAIGTHEFKGIGQGIFWMRNLTSIQFSGSSFVEDDSIDEVTISFERLLPPIFHRHTGMAEDLPGPEERHCSNGSDSLGSILQCGCIVIINICISFHCWNESYEAW